MHSSIFRQGTGKPAQGLQLRGSNHLTNGLVAFAPFSIDAATFGAAGSITNLKTLDIGPNLFRVQWQNYSSITSVYEPCPWGTAVRFGRSTAQADQNFWLHYTADQVLLDKMPLGTSPRTISALIRADPAFDIYPQQIVNYGRYIFAPANGQYFAFLYYNNSVALFTNPYQLNALYPSDGGWHMVSVVFPNSSTLNIQALIYVDGLVATSLGNTGSQTIDTQMTVNRQEWAFAIGQDNYEYAANGTQVFHGAMAGVWVWNRALTPNQQISHALDPFQMIARPRSYVTFIEVLAPPPPNPPPTCSIFSSPGTIHPGDTSTLTWTTANTPDTATIDNGIGSVNPLGGSVDVTPTTTTTYVLTVENVDGTSTCEATVIVQEIPGELEGQCNNPPSGRVGVDYIHTFIATGGVPAYTYTIIAGILPIGLILASNGVVSGIPLLRGMYFFTVQATDSNGLISTFSCNIPIAC